MKVHTRTGERKRECGCICEREYILVYIHTYTYTHDTMPGLYESYHSNLSQNISSSSSSPQSLYHTSLFSFHASRSRFLHIRLFFIWYPEISLKMPPLIHIHSPTQLHTQPTHRTHLPTHPPTPPTLSNSRRLSQADLQTDRPTER